MIKNNFTFNGLHRQIEIINLSKNTSRQTIKNVAQRFGSHVKNKHFGYKHRRLEEYILFVSCKVYQFFDGKDYLKEIYNEKKWRI